jgi:hypothetical protein
MQGTADFHHDIPDAVLPQADPVFDDAATLDAAVDMLNPQPAGVEESNRNRGALCVCLQRATETVRDGQEIEPLAY